MSDLAVKRAKITQIRRASQVILRKNVWNAGADEGRQGPTDPQSTITAQMGLLT